MRYLALFLIVCSAAIPCAASSPVHNGTLVVIGTPQASVTFTAAIYLDDSTVAIVDEETSTGAPASQNCTSSECFTFFSLLGQMEQSCVANSDPCFEQHSVSYYTGRVKKDHQDHPEIGIFMHSGGTMWFVPIIQSADQFSNSMWKDHLSGSGSVPRSPDEWQQAVSGLVSERHAASDKAAVQARISANMAEIAAQDAARKQFECLTSLTAGDDRSRVERCGLPVRTNSDLYGDQMVYPNGVTVYVKKSSNAVENVQWTH